MGLGIVCQNNGGDGLRLDNARGNHLTFYSEANATAELRLTSNANCRGNLLVSVQDGNILDSSPADSNTIFRPNRAGTYDSHARKLTAMKFIVPIDAY